jgi:hypothetical protein
MGSPWTSFRTSATGNWLISELPVAISNVSPGSRRTTNTACDIVDPNARPALQPGAVFLGIGLLQQTAQDPAGSMPLALMIGKACGPDRNFASSRAAAPFFAELPTPAE